MKYLLLFTIGPVQGFISKSRKAQDLYNGSIILSDLIKFTISELPMNSKVIFPNNSNQNDESFYPNRFLAVVETDNPKEMGKQLEKKVNDYFKSEAESLKNKYNENMSENLKSKFNKQINDFPDIFWTMLPYNENDYKNSYKRIEQNMGAIKNIREFSQNEEIGRKCSICGERDVIFYNPKKNDKQKDIIPKYLNEFVKVKDNIVSEGEGLCGLCFVKRYYRKSGNKSTAEIAVLNAVNKLNEKGDLLEDYISFFKPNDFNYEFLFEENLTPDMLKEYVRDDDSKVYHEITEKYKQIMSSLKDEKIKLSGYYAIVLSDGDSMGSWLSGGRIRDDVNLLDFHNELSCALQKFARYSSEYLDNSGYGKTIYTGGEDFMGFINISKLFEVEIELRNKFDGYVNNPLKKYFKDSNDNITFSAGIVIAHYKTPLNEVLKAVRAMEEYAKDIDDQKDAFSISVLKRSGEIVKSRYKWKIDDYYILNRLDEIIKRIIDSEFSVAFINKLHNEFYLIGEGNDIEGYLNKMIKTELGKLISRTCLIKKDDNEDKKEYENRKNDAISKMTEEVFSLYGKDFNNFISILGICEFLMMEGYYVN